MIFDKPHTLGSDDCWIHSQNLQSKEMYEYHIFNPYKTNIPWPLPGENPGLSGCCK